MAVSVQIAALQVRVLGNPTVSAEVNVEIEGAVGALRLTLPDNRGHRLIESGLDAAVGVMRTRVRLGTSAGLYLPNVGTATQQQTVKLKQLVTDQDYLSGNSRKKPFLTSETAFSYL